jgi:hypothetical protein
VLFNKCLEDKACFRLYWEALKNVTTVIAALGPQALAESTATMLAPWQAEEIAHGRFEYDAAEIKEGPYGVEETIEFIEGRGAEADAWLSANKPPEEEEKSETRETSVIVPGPSPKPPLAPGSVVIKGLAVSPGALAARISVSGPGRVTEWVTMRTPAGRRNVCTVLDQPVSLAATVRCGLSRAAERHLADHRLRLEVNISFAPANGGAPVTVSRALTARRTPRS